MSWFLSSVIVAATLTVSCRGMTMVSVQVPRYQTVSSRAKLSCNYELDNDKLYSVKWYKDGNEFYRYVPGDSPPSQVFNVQSVKVDLNLSNDRDVILEGVTTAADGTYTCEASSEAPRFKTVSGSGAMQVVSLPSSKPQLIGASARGYRVGEWMNVNCSSERAKPAPQLKWYINNEKVDPGYVLDHGIAKAGDLYSRTLGLRFELKRRHFVQGHVTVKCTASLYSVYFESSELVAQGIGLGEQALESRRTNGARTDTIERWILLLSAAAYILL